MKCPKCGYLGFEHVDRCRHCGYEFSLSAGISIPDIAFRDDDRSLNPLDDLSLIDEATPPPPDIRLADAGLDLDRMFGEADPPAPPPALPAAPAPRPRPAAQSRQEPSLFGAGLADDEPLITKASPPRPPLSVRRATPEVPRLRSEPRLASLDLALESDPEPAVVTRAATSTGRSVVEPRSEHADAADAAMGSRLLAVVIDLLILAAVDAVVIYFTMQICGLSVADVGVLPKGPLLAFLVAQNLGYFVAFTAGGQTLGKMVAGIRVVSADTDASLDLGRAFLRTAMWLVLAVPAGLGFLTALFSSDHRGLHDRFAGTRVVR
jgi:uncharacterized RDD family membrane protein YckC